MTSSITLPGKYSRTEVIEALRRLLPQMEGIPSDAAALPFDVAALDTHLPGGGLLFGALHEMMPEREGDMPAAFGFLAALLGRLPGEDPILLVFSRGALGLGSQGVVHGHGLNALGLDPARVILVEAGDDRQALWALEEALRSRAPAGVAGALCSAPDLKASRRLQLAAGRSGLPLFLLLPVGAAGASAALTRWRIGAAAARYDRFGLVRRWRWRAGLERCRNGRPDAWLVEFDHVAHRFGMAATLADPAVPDRPEARALDRTG